MTKRSKLILVAAVGGSACFAILLAVGVSGFIADRSPLYDAVDYDPRLTKIAATAKPIIIALSRYHAEHAAFPPQVADLATYLPEPLAQEAASSPYELRGWHYSPMADGAGYELARKLNWDAALLCVVDNLQARWVYGPGDGNPDKPIVLKP